MRRFNMLATRAARMHNAARSSYLQSRLMCSTAPGSNVEDQVSKEEEQLATEQDDFLKTMEEAKQHMDSVEEENKREEQAPSATPEMTEIHETVVGESTKASFQAETKRLLDIVAHSLYTDKEIFLRELISNASDACEKARYMTTLDGVKLIEDDMPLNISITTDEERGLLIIQDSGIGMSEKELHNNLGVIARSGSKEFIKSLDSSPNEAIDNIIGQFGVGFYSAFMVANRVDVYSRSAIQGEDKAYLWTSDGSGEYEVAPAENVGRGTKIIIHLSDKSFAKPANVKRIVKKYSNFVGFPVNVNGSPVETVGAIWLRSRAEVTPEQHESFYKFIANAYDAPSYTLHFHTDAPLDLHALFYFPERHMEKYGMGRLEPGVSLYSRKVLIQSKCAIILPEWLRFVKGVVDSEDIPLNISRETMQDSQLITRIRNALTRRIISFIQEIANEQPEDYSEWYQEFGNFIKEGVATDMKNRDKASRLLRFDSSKEEKAMMSLDRYVSEMPAQQKNIYYLFAPNREVALQSPYLEAFKQQNFDVIFLYSHIDEMVFQSLKEFEKRPIMSVESADVEVGKQDTESEEDKARINKIAEFMEATLASKVSSVAVSKRQFNAPAIVVDKDSSSSRRMMMLMEAAGGESMPLPAQQLEINPHHPVIKSFASLRYSNNQVAVMLVHQILDNALITAGLMQDPRTMVPRLDEMMQSIVSTQVTDMYDVEELEQLSAQEAMSAAVNSKGQVFEADNESDEYENVDDEDDDDDEDDEDDDEDSSEVITKPSDGKSEAMN